MTHLRLLLVAAVSVGALLVSPPAEAKPKHCPPGLAKKAVPCVPPGQVGKSVRRDDRDDHDHDHDHDHDNDHDDDHDHDWDHHSDHIWERGDRIRGDYVLIPRSEWERLALRDYRDGSDYVRTDNQILRVMRDTQTVIEAIGILGNLLD